MVKLTSFVQAWPVLVAALVSGAMIFSAAADDVTLPDWLTDAFAAAPEVPVQPEPPAPAPDGDTQIPFAPVPGRDDRTPVAFVSHVFELGDPNLPSKLTGIGPVYWDHAGRGTGALIARDVVLTTAHLFVEEGKWDGPAGLTNKPPSPSDGRIYLHACNRAYDLKAIHLGSMSPRARLGLDYAIVELAEPACDAAVILPVANTPGDLAGAQDQILLNMGSYAFADVHHYANHPLFADQRASGNRFEQQAVFGVRCAATGRGDTGGVSDGSTAVIETEGCDGVPGGSGGPLLASRDGGASYSIVGVANSYRPDTEYNNYTSIEGAFAKHLATFVDLTPLPAATATYRPSTSPPEPSGPWLPMEPVRAPAAPSHIAKANPLAPWGETNIHPKEDMQ